MTIVPPYGCDYARLKDIVDAFNVDKVFLVRMSQGRIVSRSILRGKKIRFYLPVEMGLGEESEEFMVPLTGDLKL